MALFQKKPIAGSSVPLYTLGQSRTVMVVGLGNPGKKYDGTRHNIGFACLDAIAAANGLSSWLVKKDLKCQLAAGTLGSTRVIAIKPETFMNLSGDAVAATASFYKLAPAQLLVIHDELDLPFGTIRTRLGGGSAGHNGLKSVIERMGPDFARIRIGVRNELADKADSADFVLAAFNKDEQAKITLLTQEVNSIFNEYIFGNGMAVDTRSFLV